VQPKLTRNKVKTFPLRRNAFAEVGITHIALNEVKIVQRPLAHALGTIICLSERRRRDINANKAIDATEYVTPFPQITTTSTS
jgi:hypothetical protein